jgi:hypothetical protein
VGPCGFGFQLVNLPAHVRNLPPQGFLGHKERAEQVSTQIEKVRNRLEYGQQIFNITEAHTEPMIDPHSIADDFRRETVSAVAGSGSLHGLSLSAACPISQYLAESMLVRHQFLILSRANSNLLLKILGFLSRSTMSNARFAHPRCPSHHDGFSTDTTRQAPSSCRRIRSDETSDVDPEPFATTVAQSPHPGSADCGTLLALD